MATKTVVTQVSDLSGEEGAETLEFGLDGVLYEVDVTDVEAKDAREVLAYLVAAARKVSGPGRPKRKASTGGAATARAASGRPNYTREESKEIRAWAAANGMQVAERGRIPNDVVDAYEKRSGTPIS